MQFKKTPQILRNDFIRNHIGFVLYENALVLPKILKKSKKYSLFSKKVNYIKARLVTKNSFGFDKRSYTFLAYLSTKNKKKIPKIKAIHSLFFLASKVRVLGEKILKSFSAKFVGKEARLLVNQYLNTYLSMYKFWYENEKWGFFDEDLTEKTKLKLMKYFWLNKPRRFLRQKLWKRAYPLDNFSFRYVKKFGYNMKSLKITDQLFFWHAFTRKRLKQAPWIFSTSQIFRKILCLKKKKTAVNSFRYKKDSAALHKIYNFFFNLKARMCVVRSEFFKFKNLMQSNQAKIDSKFLNFIFSNLRDNKNYCFILSFFFKHTVNKCGVSFFKNTTLKTCLYFFIFSYFLTRKHLKNSHLVYNGNPLSLSLFFKKS